MRFRWRRADDIVRRQATLGVLVGLIWLAIMLVVLVGTRTINGKQPRRSPRHRAPSVLSFSDKYGVPYEGAFAPTSFDSEDTHEAELAVPRSFAQRLFGEAYVLLNALEEQYDVLTYLEPRGGKGGGYFQNDEMVATLKMTGGVLQVESLRAKMRGWVHSVELERIKPHYGRGGDVEALSVPDDILAVYGAGGGWRMKKFERDNKVKVLISEEADPQDASARLVTAMGDPTVAEEPAWYLYILRKELASAFDIITLGVWQTTSTKIDPDKARFVIGQDGLIMKDLVDRTRCHIHFGPVQPGSYPARQKIRIDGPENAPNSAKREIKRLIREGESRKTRHEHLRMTAKSYEEYEVARPQRREDPKMAQQEDREEEESEVSPFGEAQSADYEGFVW